MERIKLYKYKSAVCVTKHLICINNNYCQDDQDLQIEATNVTLTN